MRAIGLRFGTGLVLLVAAGLALSCQAKAQTSISFMCSAQEEYCQALTTAYERTGAAKIAMVRKSTGEAYAQVKSESGNPKTDLWWGGTGDPHLQAALEELTEPYRSPVLPQLHDWAQKQAERSNFRTVGVYAGALGIIYNPEILPKRGLSAIKCWADLLDPKLKDEVQVADPNSSGTAYTMLATLVQIMGEDKGFDYMKKLHLNVNQYTKSGGAPVKATALGETTTGIVFMSDALVSILAKGRSSRWRRAKGRATRSARCR